MTVKPESESVLTEILSLVNNHIGWKLKVQGHTDSAGAKAMNQKLSQARAEAVIAWLASKGVDKSRLEAEGLGDSKPPGDNGTEKGRAQNRRVQLVKT